MNCHNFSVIIISQRILVSEMFNTFYDVLIVMDELNPDVEYMQQFQDRDFRLLRGLIFPGNTF